MGLFSKLKKAVSFENFGVKRLIKGIKKNPTVLLTGASQNPLSTKLNNAVFNKNNKPLTNQLGGHSASAYAEYGKDPGYAPQLNQIANTIAGFYAGGALGNAAGGAAQAAGASANTAGLVGQAASRGGMMAANAANADGAVSSPGNSPSTGTPTGLGSTMPNQPNNSTYTGRDAWFVNAAQGALNRAGELADRPYTAYGGERVAGLSANEQQAGSMAANMGDSYKPMADRLKTGFSTESLGQYMNPYTDAVLGGRLRTIGDEYGRQSTDLTRDAAARDAMRGGRSDIARSRLNLGRMRALDDATNEVKSAAFESGKDSYFKQGSQDLGAIGALSGAESNQISALNTTGGAERQVRQANNDFNYGQFLEARDWDMNNLNGLLNALGSIAPAAGSLTKTKGGSSKSADYAAIAGTLASAVGEYYSNGGGGGGGGGSAGGGWTAGATVNGG